MMDIQIVSATLQDETAFRNLYQFYMYEFSTFMGWAPNYAGRFPEDDLDGCWTDKKRHPFLIKVDGRLAGFAIVDHPDGSCFGDEPNAVEPVAFMAEFFVMAAVQGQGVGERVAVMLFEMFPGRWEVFELNQNKNAQAFWRKIIGRYTNNNYQERQFQNRAVVQVFDAG
jgi:predicted acetyltransferase